MTAWPTTPTTPHRVHHGDRAAFDPTTGELTQTGAPLARLGHPATAVRLLVAVHEGSRRLFAVGTSTIAVFDRR
jgi:hypothetical protein